MDVLARLATTKNNLGCLARRISFIAQMTSPPLAPKTYIFAGFHLSTTAEL